MSTARPIEIVERSGLGTGFARAVRRTGFVPAIVYGNNQAPVTVSVEERVLVKEMKQPGFTSHLFEINLGGKKENVLIRSFQLHPVSDRPLHVDFLRVSGDSKITVYVALKFINETLAPGVRLGGVVNILHHTLPLSCPSSSIPEVIEVDLAHLEIGGSISVRDVKLPQDVKVIHPEKIETVVNIVPPKVVSETEEATTSEPSVSSAAAAPKDKSSEG